MSRRRSVALLFAGLLVSSAACGDGDGGSTQAAVRDSAGSAAQPVDDTTATSTTAAAAAGPTSTSTTVRGVTTTTTRRTTTTTRATVPAGPRALTPPAAGTYRYDTSGATVVAGSTIAFPAVTTLVVDPPSGTRQRSTRNLRDASGNGSAVEFTLDYRPTGVHLVALRLTTGFAGATDVRDLAPPSPVLLLPTGAGAGAHLEYDLAAAGGAGTARLVVDVLGGERVTIGGQGVDTLVMRAVVTLPPGDVTGRQELTVNVDPNTRLWVRERSKVDASAAGGLITLRSEYAATLQRLTP